MNADSALAQRSGGQPIIAAAVDVGSNSAHLLVAQVVGRGLTPLLDESSLLGLGSRVDSDAEIGAVARDELVGVLAAYAAKARGLGATEITVVGTEPIRRARDTRILAGEVERASGIGLETLDHDDEGLLTLLGVATERAIRPGVAVVDVGGGSTELILVGKGCKVSVKGLLIGSARLTDQLVTHDPPTADEMTSLRDESVAALANVDGSAPNEMVGVGGAAWNLLRVVEGAQADGILTVARLDEIMRVLGGETAEEASERHRVRLTRARILPAGAAILEAVMAHYGVSQMSVIDAGIREGLVLATAQAGPRWRKRLRGLVAETCADDRARRTTED